MIRKLLLCLGFLKEKPKPLAAKSPIQGHKIHLPKSTKAKRSSEGEYEEEDYHRNDFQAWNPSTWR